VRDVAEGAQLGCHPGPGRGDDQAVEQAADLSGAQRDRPAVPGMAKVTNRCQPVQVRTSRSFRHRRDIGTGGTGLITLVGKGQTA
jgi:hypothetical protein